MKAQEFSDWARSLPEDYIRSLARLTELRTQNNKGLTGELYRSMMEQNRDQVRREYESSILVPDTSGHKVEPDGRGFCKACGKSVMVDDSWQTTDPKEILPWKHVYPEKPENIPHAARMVSQFRLEVDSGGKNTFVSTGKVMCWCNCGATTGWFDLFEGPYVGESTAQKFFSEHKMSEELGIRMGYNLGELAGYSVNAARNEFGELEAHLGHSCGWWKVYPGCEENMLTGIILEILNNTHICGDKT